MNEASAEMTKSTAAKATEPAKSVALFLRTLAVALVALSGATVNTKNMRLEYAKAVIAGIAALAFLAYCILSLRSQFRAAKAAKAAGKDLEAGLPHSGKAAETLVILVGLLVFLFLSLAVLYGIQQEQYFSLRTSLLLLIPAGIYLAASLAWRLLGSGKSGLPGARLARVCLVACLSVFLALTTLQANVCGVDYLKRITLDGVEAQMASDSDFVMVFGSPSCIYCFQMGPIYARSITLGDLFSRRMVYCSVEGVKDDDARLDESALNISQIPVMIHYVDGVEVSRLVGVLPGQDVIDFLAGLQNTSQKTPQN